MSEPDFNALWKKYGDQVVRYCQRYTQSAHEAEEVCQRIAIRAWRHFSTLLDRSIFLSWVLAIARRELARWGNQRRTQRSRQLEYPDLHLLPATEAEQAPALTNADSKKTWLPSCIDAASTARFLSPVEGAVLKERLADNADWQSIGQRLGITANAAAVTHCRAIPRLRVFLFLFRPNLLGGIDAVRAAFEEARQHSSSGLTDGEAAAFERIILHRDDRYRPLQWKVDLRAACGKVAKKLRGELP